MPFDQNLADRTRRILAERCDVTERKMFGGLSFMVNGHMCCGVIKQDLVVRLGPEKYSQALSNPGVREMDFTGRALKGFIYVGPEGYQSDKSLKKWINAGLDFILTLPPK